MNPQNSGFRIFDPDQTEDEAAQFRHSTLYRSTMMNQTSSHSQNQIPNQNAQQKDPSGDLPETPAQPLAHSVRALSKIEAALDLHRQHTDAIERASRLILEALGINPDDHT
jgi:transcriptional regulator of met regulon